MPHSFFDKLKKGLGLEETEREKKEEKPGPEKEEKKETKKEEIKTPGERKEKISPTFSLESLTPPAGELAVDLYQTEDELVIRSAIAGVKPEKLDILIEQDVITISGKREEPEEKGKIDYFTRECYFGPFSRKIISPVEIDASRAKAVMKDGILVIRIPKIQREKKIKIEVEKA
jgi:HSP20 family protein